MKKLTKLVLVALIFLTLGNLQSPAIAGDSKPLSDYGSESISELATCLRTSTNLDVFYLIDASNSLKETDKKNQRQEIIKQDIQRWAQIAQLKPGIEISIAGALFNRSASVLSSWQSLTPENAASVSVNFTRRINNQNLANYTNWKAGLQDAYDKLSVRSATCKAVIWFTDGGLWSPYGDRRESLNDLADLCGPAEAGDVPRGDSAEGLMSQIRRAGIHVYGILLHDSNKGEDQEESFYRSLMQPLLEESGQVRGSGGLPSGEMKCGENLTGEDKDYASGAYLEATSPAEVAFKFMKIPATVQDGSEFGCPKNGQFYVDPGIAKIEFATDATSWKIQDSDGKLLYQSSGAVNGTTSKITVPPLAEPETWTFVPVGGTGLCALYVYPQIDLELHDKALVGGRTSSITGQFFASLSSREKIDFNVFKKADFNAKVDGLSQDASLNKGTGTFEIKNFTPKSDATEAVVTAKLLLATQHYELNPVELKKSKQVFSPSAIPTVGKITFGEPLYGSTGKAIATTVISAPEDTNQTSQVCFEKSVVIGDHQDESNGKATDRSKSWSWKIKGVDSNGCLNILISTNRDQTVTFELSNPKQANSEGVALFEYSILRNGEPAVKDSQTAAFETREKRSGALFWMWLLVCMIVGLAIPFGILTILHRLSTHFVIPKDLLRAEFSASYDPTSGRVTITDPEFEKNTEIPKYFKTLFMDQKVTYKTWSDPGEKQLGQDKTVLINSAINFESKPNWWPLGKPNYKSLAQRGRIAVVGTADAPSPSGSQKLENPNLLGLAYFTALLTDFEDSANSQTLLPGVIVIYTQQPAVFDGIEFKEKVLDAALSSNISTYLSQLFSNSAGLLATAKPGGGGDAPPEAGSMARLGGNPKLPNPSSAGRSVLDDEDNSNLTEAPATSRNAIDSSQEIPKKRSLLDD